jgi:DNA-directed RNA polymerase subunit RPC12/RpoP
MSTEIDPASQIACPYCFEPIHKDATRCNHCSGEILFCPRCGKKVGITTKRRWVGVLRGGTRDVKNCVRCGKRLAGGWL